MGEGVQAPYKVTAPTATSVAAGATVTYVVQPNAGTDVITVTIKGADNTVITPEIKKEGTGNSTKYTYTFTMPAQNVTITGAVSAGS